MDGAKKARVDIFSIIGGKPTEDADDGDMSSADLALKAAFKAVKNDDFEGFKEGMSEWMKCCSDEQGAAESESEDYD